MTMSRKMLMLAPLPLLSRRLQNSRLLALLGLGAVRPASQRVAPGQVLKDAVDFFVDKVGNRAGLAFLVREELENGGSVLVDTVFQVSAEVQTLVDGPLKYVDVPAVDLWLLVGSRQEGLQKTYEITVESVSSRVTVRQDKRLRVAVPLVREDTSVPDNLVEDGDEMHGVALGAGAVVEGAGFGIRDVGLVVLRVQVLAVPAAGEEDLGAETVGAVLSRELVGFGLWLGVIVETDVADGLGGEVVSEAPLEWVAGDHPEVLGKGLDFVLVWTAALAGLLVGEVINERILDIQVIHIHAAGVSPLVPNLGNTDEATVLGVIV